MTGRRFNRSLRRLRAAVSSQLPFFAKLVKADVGNARSAALPLLTFFLCLLAAGCTTTGTGWDTAEPFATAPPASVPAGFRLGEVYFSALGEQCREAFPENDPSRGPGAMCLRNGTWERVPDIFLSVPTTPAPSQGGARRS
jgi:hypothetical protein